MKRDKEEGWSEGMTPWGEDGYMDGEPGSLWPARKLTAAGQNMEENRKYI